MRNCFLRLFVVLALVLMSFDAQSKQVAEKVRPCSEVFAYKGLAYFCATQTGVGAELFVSDGSQYGSRLFLDIDDEPGSSSPTGFFEHDGVMFFLAETNFTGWGLYRSNGTNEGTKLIRPFIATHESVSYGLEINVVARIGRDVYFEIDGINDPKNESKRGRLLFKTDGTYVGTAQVRVPITYGYATYNTQRAATSYFVLNQQLFVLTDSTLYKVTSPNSHEEVTRFPRGNSQFDFTAKIDSGFSINGKMVVIVADGRPDGNLRLNTWLSDGTSTGSSLYRAGVMPIGAIGNLLLVADHPTSDAGIIMADGSYLSLPVKIGYFSPTARPSGRHPSRAIKFGSKLLFLEYVPGSWGGRERLWVTDGSINGTYPLQIGRQFVVQNESVYGVKASDPAMILKSDGTQNSSIIVANTELKGFSEVASASGRIYAIESNTNQTSPRGRIVRLWAGTGLGGLNPVGDRLEIGLGILKDDLIQTEGHRIFLNGFRASAASKLNHIYHSDGTRAGTYPLMYRYEDGANPDPVKGGDFSIITPIIDLILESDR